MARSLKKGPFADESLLKKVDAMNAAGDKTVIKTWSRNCKEHHLRQKRGRALLCENECGHSE